MTNFAATDGLLVGEQAGQINPKNVGASVAVEFTSTKETAPQQISVVLPRQTSVEPVEPFHSEDATTGKAPASLGLIRWWDLFFITLNAYLGWTIFCFLFALIGGFLWFAMGYGTDLGAFAKATSTNFYFTQVAMASFYLALLLAMRRVLRKRRGSGSFAGFFRPVKGTQLFYAALSGLAWYSVLLVLASVLFWAADWQNIPSGAGIGPQPHLLSRLAISGLVGVILAPFAEELYFRGLLMEWFQQRLSFTPSALITAAIFAVYHLRFLQYSGVLGWIATGAVAALALICALWAHRTRSLRAPVAAHAAYNAAIILLFGH